MEQRHHVRYLHSGHHIALHTVTDSRNWAVQTLAELLCGSWQRIEICGCVLRMPTASL